MAKAPTIKMNLKDSLAQLNTIVKWFESQDEIDVEAGLEKVREGAELVKICKERLSGIENEFEQIKREAESDSGKMYATAKSPDHDSEEDIDPDKIPF